MESNLSPEDKKKIGVYLIHNPETDVAYVGSGILGVRQKVHEYLLNKGAHWNYKFQNAFNENPNFQFLGLPVEEGDEDHNRSVALELEQSDIDELWGPQLLNISRDVYKPMNGRPHTEETILKNREAALRNWQDPAYRENVIQRQNEGKQAIPSQQRDEINKQIGETHRQLCAAGLRKTNKGQVRSQEFIDNNSRRILEKWQDPAYRETQMQARAQSTAYAANKKPVVGDGIEYESVTAAAVATGLHRAAILYRINSSKQDNWHFKET